MSASSWKHIPHVLKYADAVIGGALRSRNDAFAHAAGAAKLAKKPVKLLVPGPANHQESSAESTCSAESTFYKR